MELKVVNDQGQQTATLDGCRQPFSVVNTMKHWFTRSLLLIKPTLVSEPVHS